MRRTCGEAGGLSKWGKPCASVFIDRDTHLCRAHDPTRTEERRASDRKGGRHSRSKKLTRSLQRLVTLLTQGQGESLQGTVLGLMTPEPWVPPETCLHLQRIEPSGGEAGGYRALGEPICMWHCRDLSAFHEALRMYRIRDHSGTYRGWVRGVFRTIPGQDIELLRKLTKRLPAVVREGQ